MDQGAAAAAPRDRRRETRHRREERWAGVVSQLVRLLPRRAALALGRGLGRLLADLDRKHVAIAADNLRQAFPHWDEPRVLRTAHAVYAHFGQVLLDILWLEGRSREELLALTEPVGFEHPRAIQAAGRGIVLVGAHLGNWEVHGICHGLLCGSIGVVARPLDNPALDRRLCAFRSAWGNTVIYKQRALAQILRTVRGGGTVAILVDQNVQEKDGIFVPFFDRPAASTTVAAAIAIKTGCAIVPARTELLPNGRYRLKCEPPLEWTPTEDRQADIAHLTARLAQVIESWVRDTPEQWLWMHRRWKTQPAPADRAPSGEGAAIDPAAPGAAREGHDAGPETPRS